MTNTSFLLAPLFVTTTTTTTTTLLGLLGGHHPRPFLPHPHPHLNNNNNNNSGLLMNSTTRAYRTEEEGGGGVGMEGSDSGARGSCEDWQEAQHTLFQLANLCMALSFLTPASFRFHLLFLRCLLLLAFGLFVLWGALFMCMADVLAWNLLFFLLDGGHIAWLIYRHMPSRLPLSHAVLYTKVFKPVRVAQTEFLDLCELGSLQPVHKGGLYAMEGLTPSAQRLSILLKGRLKVTYQRMFLHSVEVNQFVDAVEYDSLALQHDNSDKYQVSIAATEDSVLLTWDYPALKEYLTSHPFMDTLFHYLIGKDVCNQLYAIQEQLLLLQTGGGQQQDYLTSSLPPRQSSMVNLRSCLAAHDPSCPSSTIPHPHPSPHPHPPSPHPPHLPPTAVSSSGGRELYEAPSPFHHPLLLHNTLETSL